MASRRTGYPIAGGILAIIAACANGVFGVTSLLTLFSTLSLGYDYYGFSLAGIFALVWIFGVSAFAWGLLGGIMSLRRRNFVLSIIGMSVVIVSGFATIIGYSVFGDAAIWISLLFSPPIIALSALSLIFAAISRKEFS